MRCTLYISLENGYFWSKREGHTTKAILDVLYILHAYRTAKVLSQCFSTPSTAIVAKI